MSLVLVLVNRIIPVSTHVALGIDPVFAVFLDQVGVHIPLLSSVRDYLSASITLRLELSHLVLFVITGIVTVSLDVVSFFYFLTLYFQD